MRRELLLLAALSTGVVGCDVIAGLINAISELSLLGAMPDQDFAVPNSPNAGKVRIAIGALSDSFIPIQPAVKNLRVETADGEEVPVEESEEVEGFEEGTFALLVDGSGSTEYSGCTGCPTDPDRIRVEAVRELANALHACGPDWRQGLFEFGIYETSAGFDFTVMHTDWTTDPSEVSSAADKLSSQAGTPLWDSTNEVLDKLNKAYTGDDSNGGMGIVVLSDGADSGYGRTVTQVANHAVELGIRVHTVGFGPAADGDSFQDRTAVEDLMTLARETGGYYGYVSSMDQLPALGEAIAMAQCGGHTQLVVTWPEAEEGEKYDGRVVYKDNDAIAVPFSFTGPRK